MYMVKCEEKYWPFVLKLRNQFREFFFSQSIITDEQHQKFMEKWSKNYFICISHDGESPLGWVGVVDNDIRIAVSKKFQSQGVGKFMLESIKDLYPDATAQILAENISSIRLFESAKIPLEIIE